jgi:hypothetical protein
MLPLRIRRQQQQTYDIDPPPIDCFEIDRSVKANQYPEGLAHAQQPSMGDSNPPAGSGRSQGFRQRIRYLIGRQTDRRRGAG